MIAERFSGLSGNLLKMDAIASGSIGVLHVPRAEICRYQPHNVRSERANMRCSV